MITEPDRLLDRALAYARRGWPVFPCRPGGKEPFTRHGFRDASTDLGQIQSWWNRQPGANVAIATGLPGPDVLDVDQHGPAGNGFNAYRRLQAAGLLGDGQGAIIATPGGGLHLYFRGSTQASGRLPRQHLDFRSAGGYVLAPPSQIGGRRYRIIRPGLRSVGLDWAAVTSLLASRDRPAFRRGSSNTDCGRLVAWVGQLPKGNRNCGLFWAACRVAESGQPELLAELAAAAARTGLPEREIARTIASARRSALRSSRRQTDHQTRSVR